MRAEKQDQPSRDKARRLTKKTLAAGGVVTTLAVVGSFAGIGAATAAETDVTEAEGRFLTFDGALGDTVNVLAELAPAYSATPSGESPNSRSLDLELLSALDISLGDGLQLFGENPILGLGALGQYSSTDATSAYASSGLLGEEGAIAPAAGNDPSENAYLDLAPILGSAGLDALLEDARLELGAISASAAIAEDGEPEGEYQIAGGTLLLTSPVVSNLSGSLVDVLGQVSDPINALAGEGGVIDETVDPLLDGVTSALNTVLLGIGSVDDLGVTATVDVDLEAAVQSVLAEPITSEDSVVTIDFSTGEVSVDLARLVADTQGGDYDGTLNGLPANTELLDPDLVQAALDGAIGSVFDQIPALVVNAVTDALNAVDVNIELYGEINSLVGNIGTVDVVLSGTLGDFIGAEGSQAPDVDTSGTSIVGLPVGTLLQPVLQAITNTILPALVTPLSAAITDAGALDTIFRPVVETANTVLQPLFGLVTNNLLSLTANVQENGGTFTHEDAFDTENTFTERALELTLLPASPILQLALGSATVRGDFDAAPVYETAITITPESIEQGETATIEGSGFAPNESVSVTIDGVEVGPVDTDDDGNFTLPYETTEETATGTFDVIATGEVSNVPATGSLEITEGDAGADPEADANADADVDGDENTNASASASASANADDESNAAAQVAAQAAATADADTTASAAADADATAAAQSAANEDASSDASADVSSDVNASAQAAAQAAANADASSTSNAEASAEADASANAAAASQAAANADSSSDASAEAAANADADVNGSSDDEGDVNANASSSASASANADDESNASAQAAAQAAANADADTAASAAADADATAAAQSAATADASTDASADVSSDVNASAQAAAQAAANADASSTSNADASSAADANASAAAAAASNADSSSDASSEAAANADADVDASGGVDADVNGASNDDADADVDGASDADGENANASSSASASANADDESNASAQAAAQAAANADADTAASAAADADATAAAQSAATADASTDASADVSSDVNASAQAAAQAAANADASSASNAEASAEADASANAAAASQAAANADSSSDASSEASASSDSDASASASASSDDDANASSDADASTSANSDSSSDADSESASNANASSAADGQQISMELENDRLMVGQEQVAHGHGFQPGESVTATQYSTPYVIGTAVADDNGDVTFTWSVPNGTEDGNHVVELTGETSGSVDATFEVYSTGAGGLSPTGGDMALPLGGLAAAMLLAGAGVWFAVRRRAHA